jgi:hypothetical protein
VNSRGIVPQITYFILDRFKLCRWLILSYLSKLISLYTLIIGFLKFEQSGLLLCVGTLGSLKL